MQKYHFWPSGRATKYQSLKPIILWNGWNAERIELRLCNATKSALSERDRKQFSARWPSAASFAIPKLNGESNLAPV